MSLRIAINGFGRIGRNILRAQHEQSRPDIDIVMINDLADIETSAHLLEYDSVHGRFDGAITSQGQIVSVNGHEISYHSQSDPSQPRPAQAGTA